MNIIENVSGNEQAKAVAGSNIQVVEGIILPRFKFRFEAFDRHGRPLWVEEIENLVTNGGRNDILDKYFKGAAYTAAWYVGLKSTGAPNAADTMASHASWTEVVAYSQATRPVLTLGTVASQSVSNTASKAVYSINSDSTQIAGAFTTTNNTKSGTSGILYSVSDFSAPRTLGNGDTMNITVTLTS